jgi:hypothetical protein
VYVGDRLGNLSQISLAESHTGNFPAKSIKKAHLGAIKGIAFDSQNKILYTADDFGVLNSISVDDFSTVHTFGKIHNRGFYQISVSHNGEFLTMVDWTGGIIKFSLAEEKVTNTYFQASCKSARAVVSTYDDQC